jgi:hypothetical protein
MTENFSFFIRGACIDQIMAMVQKLKSKLSRKFEKLREGGGQTKIWALFPWFSQYPAGKKFWTYFNGKAQQENNWGQNDPRFLGSLLKNKMGQRKTKKRVKEAQ